MLVSACGGCLTATARHDEMGSIQMLSAQIRGELGVAATASDAVLIQRLRVTLRSSRLPAAWRSLGVDENMCLQEVLDGLEYARSPEGRLAVELRRIFVLNNGYALPAPPFAHSLHSNRVRPGKRALCLHPDPWPTPSGRSRVPPVAPRLAHGKHGDDKPPSIKPQKAAPPHGALDNLGATVRA